MIAPSGTTSSSGPGSNAGFTLVELITVIVIVGVLGSIALPRFFGQQPFNERGYYEELAAALRYSQKAAVNTGCPVRFVLTAGTYAASQQQPVGGRCDPSDTSWSEPLALSDGTTVAGTAPAGVTAAPPLTIVFDALGATSLAGNQAIAVGPFSLSIQAASGYVDAP